MGACALETKAAGDLGSIAEQEVDHKVDVLLGGGRGRFEQKITGGPDAGKNVIESAQAKGYRYVSDAAGLSAVPNSGKPVLGLFNSSNMSLEWSGPAASLGKGNTPASCNESQRPANEPSLAAMTTKDGQTLSLTYGTAGYGGPGAAPVAAPPSRQHTGAVVPVWGSGPGSLDILGTNDHTDLFDVLGG